MYGYWLCQPKQEDYLKKIVQIKNNIIIEHEKANMYTYLLK